MFGSIVTQAVAEVESLLTDQSFAAALQDFAATLPLARGLGQGQKFAALANGLDRGQIETALPMLEAGFDDLSAGVLSTGVDLAL